MDNKGCSCIVNLLSYTVPLNSSEPPGGSEVAATECVCGLVARRDSAPVVQAQLISLHWTAEHSTTGHGPGHYAAIVMPQYCGGVATVSPMSKTAVEAEGWTMVRAIVYVQSKGLVHMDVKVICCAVVWPCAGHLGSCLPSNRS